MVAKDDTLSKNKDIDKLVALISLSFKKIYKPTNNNLRTSSNTNRENHDNTPRVNRGTGYDNQRAVNVVGARENVGTQVVQRSGIQCYNCKEYGNVARECQNPKRANDAAYHKEKMLLCKQEEAGFQLNAEKIQEVTPDAADNFGPIFNTDPLQKVQNDDDNYNVFANHIEHPEQLKSFNDTYLEEQGDTNIIIDLLDMSTNREMVDQDDDDLARERNLLASLIDKLKCKIDDCKNYNKLLESSNKTLVDKLKGEIEDFKTKNKSLESSNNHFKEANNKLSKSNQLMFKDLKKFQAKHDRYHDVNYASKVKINCAKAKGVIPTTSVSRSQLQSNQFEDRVMPNNSQGKMQELVEIILFIIDSGCSKHMMGNPKLQSNYVEKFLGKSKQESFHTKTTPSSKRRLQLLYIDLCGPMRVESINGKKYVLVIVDDYSRYTWTHFLRSKDETPKVLINFLKLVQRGLHVQVRTVRMDKGMEFLNKTLHAYFAREGIVHQTSTAQTPEQNGVVKRQNRTLVKAAQIMLSAAKVPLFFWAEKITTTCFTQMRLLVIPRHEKTPYHIINGRKPSVKFFHIVGLLCYIVKDEEKLDKIKEKGDACIFVGYSTQLRAYTKKTSARNIWRDVYVRTHMSRTEPKNIKEAMADSAWIEAMQEELHQFDQLDVWELVDRPLCKNVINMKWLWKNKNDEENTIIRNKARLVANGYNQQEGIFKESFAQSLD
nr:retrovirus-related Pol polyprotein from transposon TNT 1-94 [Tanacetum cinerariifolium]